MHITQQPRSRQAPDPPHPTRRGSSPMQSDTRSNAQRYDETRNADERRPLRRRPHRARVDLQTHQKQEEHKANVRGERQDGDALLGEDAVREVGNAAEDGGPEEDAADDLGDDARLADASEKEGEELGEDDDDADLDDP